MSGAEPQRRILRSIGAVLAGLIIGVALSLVTDMAMAAIGVLPPNGKPATSGPLAFATVYRTIYGVLASYVAARLASYRPMVHAMVLGVLDFIVSIVGLVLTWNKSAEYGPHWYPIALVILALPAAWLGGKLRMNQLSLDGPSPQSAAA